MKMASPTGAMYSPDGRNSRRRDVETATTQTIADVVGSKPKSAEGMIVPRIETTATRIVVPNPTRFIQVWIIPAKITENEKGGRA